LGVSSASNFLKTIASLTNISINILFIDSLSNLILGCSDKMEAATPASSVVEHDVPPPSSISVIEPYSKYG